MDVITQTKIDELLNSFQYECEDGKNVYYDAEKLYNDQSIDFSEKMRNIIVEHVVVQLFSKWEKFLENIFIQYMLGEKSENGRVAVRYVFPIDSEHAYRLIQSVNLYPDWSDVDKILVNARNFFENGGPFEILKTMKAELNALKRIRNAVAHISFRAQRDFEKLVQNKIGFLPNGITPVKFLINYKIGKKRLDPTYYEYYIEYLKGAASVIAEFSVENDFL